MQSNHMLEVLSLKSSLQFRRSHCTDADTRQQMDTRGCSCSTSRGIRLLLGCRASCADGLWSSQAVSWEEDAHYKRDHPQSCCQPGQALPFYQSCCNIKDAFIILKCSLPTRNGQSLWPIQCTPRWIYAALSWQPKEIPQHLIPCCYIYSVPILQYLLAVRTEQINRFQKTYWSVWSLEVPGKADSLQLVGQYVSGTRTAYLQQVHDIWNTCAEIERNGPRDHRGWGQRQRFQPCKVRRCCNSPCVWCQRLWNEIAQRQRRANCRHHLPLGCKGTDSSPNTLKGGSNIVFGSVSIQCTPFCHAQCKLLLLYSSSSFIWQLHA